MEGAQKARVLAIIFMVIAFWFLVLATLAALHLQKPEKAEAPIAAFAKNGDDRSLPPIFSALQKSRHYLALKGVRRVRDLDASESNCSSPERRPVFVFGDSTMDVGNNNFLSTIARANLPPYGRDFIGGVPTGRFSNGRMSVDYLAEKLGFPHYIEPYMKGLDTASVMTWGANFASAGAGILDTSGSDLGARLSVNDQVRLMGLARAFMVSLSGEEEAKKVMSKAIYYISAGSNDYIHDYLRGFPSVRNKTSSLLFSRQLANLMKKNIEKLYALGARKFVVNSVGPLGCIPFYLRVMNAGAAEKGSSKRDICMESINFLIRQHNLELRFAVEKLREKLMDNAVIVYCDVYHSLMSIIFHADKYNFTNARVACCGVGRFGGLMMCMFPAMACSNAEHYIWWDPFHPTEKANQVITEELWSGDYCDPLNLQELSMLS